MVDACERRRCDEPQRGRWRGLRRAGGSGASGGQAAAADGMQPTNQAAIQVRAAVDDNLLLERHGVLGERRKRGGKQAQRAAG